MATDSTHLLTGDTSVESDTDMSAGSSDLGSVQLAAANPDAPIPVNIPRGQQVVVIPVRPGQTIELPTDSVNGLLAKLGADGNLAIVVDGRTIILQGYAEANAESPIKIVTNDGDLVDIAEVIVATNPDVALDIQTAAGPAAGAQGGTNGADAAGSGIFVPFAAGPLLGGFDAAGTLKATDLAYKNIDDERVLFTHDEEKEDEPNPPTIDFFPNDPEAKNGRAVVSDEGLKGGLPDTDPNPEDETNDTVATGTFVVSDPDLPGDTLTVTLLTDGLPALKFGGETVDWILDPDGHTLHGQTGGSDAIVITISSVGGLNYDYEVTLIKPLDHPLTDDPSTPGTETSFEDQLSFNVGLKVTDSTGLFDTAQLEIEIEDDSPVLEIRSTEQVSGSLFVELDETVGPDRYAPGEAADGGNTDDAGPGLAQRTTDILGGLKALFVAGGGYGADGPGTFTDGVSFIGIPVGGLPTNLSATDGGAITLFASSATLIEGKDGDGDVVFTIEIVDVGGGVLQLQTTLFEALVHGDNSKFDETAELLVTQGLVQLQYEATVTDADGDAVTDTDEINLITEEGSYFTFDDDGPSLTVTAKDASALAVELDETVGTDRAAPGEIADGNDDDAGPGLGQKTTSIAGGLANLFTVGGDFGSDGPGTLSDGTLSFLGFGGGDLATNLEATDGGAIVLHLDSPTLIQGKDGDGDVVFTIEIVDVGGGVLQLQTTLFEALVHGDNSKFDETVELLLEEGTVQLQYEVTRTDGDNDPITESATIDLISDESWYFSFDDDGPTLTVGVDLEAASGLAVELDETEGTDRAAPGEVADGNTDDAGPGLGQKTTDITGGLKALFPVGGDFGSDGAGTLTDKLSFGGFGGGDLDTNLEATNGGAIVLHLDSPTLIQGKDGDGDVVFTIEIVDVGGGVLQLQTTLFEALVHGDNTKFDESVQLLLEEGTVQLQYEATRTDGDNDPITKSASIDLISDESSYFTFDDDGPTLTVNPSTQGTGGLAVELDETVGTDRAAPGEVADGNSDDAGPGLGQKTTAIIGGLSGLFSVVGDFGSDGKGSITDGILSFGGFAGGDLDTNLEATDGGAIVLHLDSPTLIQGKDGDGDVVLTIEIVEVNPGEFQLQTTLFEALVQGDNTKFDESIELMLEEGLVQLQYEVTITDGDGDPLTKSSAIDLISEEGSFFTFDDDGPTLTVDVDGRAAAGLAVELDETEGADRAAPGEVADGNTDDAGPGLGQRTTDITGGLKALFPVGGDFGSDGPGTLTDKLGFGGFGGGDLDTTLEATDGGAIVLHLDSPTLIQGKDGDGDVVFTIEIVDVGGGVLQLQTTLFEALVHGDNSKFDETVELLLEEGTVQLQYEVTRTDGDNDPITESATIDLISDESSYFTFDDDGPSLTVTAKDASALAVELDETVGTDRAAPGEIADGNDDDAGPGLGQKTTSIAGGLANLFTVGGDFGSDGPGTLSDGTLSFLGFGGGDLATNLEATDGGAIVLHLDSPTLIQGKDGDGDVVFTIEIVDVGGGVLQLQTTLFEALVHGDNSKFDETVELLLEEGTVQLQYEVTRTDGDNDPITESATIDLISDESSYFSFDDDGPTLTVGVDLEAASGLAVELDETEGTDRAAPGEVADGNTDDAGPGLGQKTTDITGGLKALFPVGGDFGSDGAGTLTDKLSFGGFGGGDLDTNLEATNGGAIVLHLDSPTLIQGKDGDGDVVFTIEIVDVGGGVLQLQTTLFEALVHGDNTKFDESVQLLLEEGTVQLQYEATRTDGDNDPITKSASIDLISDESSYFTFDDDGPTLTVNPSTQGTGGLAVELDETVGTDRAAPGEVADGNSDDAGPGLGQKTSTVPGGLKGLFLVGGDFGSDGPGTLTDKLGFGGFSGGDLETTLEATDGGAIVLHLDSPTLIQGKDSTGDVVFTIEIVDVGGGVLQLQTTLFEALVHGDNSKFDEAVQLLLEEGAVQLVYEATRTDGDGDPLTKSASINLITEEGSYFTFDDDGPSLTVTPKDASALAVELDETEGPDRAAPGETADGNDDDAGPGLGQKTTNITGGLANLFTVGGDFGSDGPGTLSDGTLSFLGFGGGDLATNLEATDGGAIVLHLDSPTLIQGKDSTGDVVFTIEIVDVGGGVLQLQTTLFEALVHGDNSKFDEAVQLLLEEGTVQLQYEVTRTDGDNDPITEAATIDLISDESSYFSFDDDGPDVTATSGTLTLTVDESVGGAPGFDAPGGGTTQENDEGAFVMPAALTALGTTIGEAQANAAGLFTSSAGSDGEDSKIYSLTVTGGGVTGLVDTATGLPITLVNVGGGVIEGQIAGGIEVFALTIDPVTGLVSMAQYRAIHHGAEETAPGVHDEVKFMNPGVLSVTLTVTDKDGDSDSASKDVSGSISFDDDGPTMEDIPNIVMANQVKTVTGQIEFDPGSDGVGTFIISSVDDGGLASSLAGIGTNQVTGLDGDGDPIYVLTVDEDGQYHFQLLQTSLEGTVQFDLTGVEAGGPVPSITFNDTVDPSAQIVFENAEQDGNPANFNPSNGEFGVGSNLFNKNESWTTTFVGFLASTFTLAYDFNGSGLLTIHYTAYDSSGDTVIGSFDVSAAGETTVDFVAAGAFDGLVTHIDFSITSNTNNQSAKIKLTEFSAETITPPEDQHISFDVALQDGDGDTTATQNFTVDVLATDPVPATPAFDLIGTTEDDVLAGYTGKVDNFNLTAGGHDVVQLTSKLDGNDVITGFNNGSIAAEQDYVDLDPLFDSLAIASGARAALVNVSVSGADIIVKLDVDGVAGFDDAGDIHITIKGVTSGISVGTGPNDDVQVGSL